MRIRFISLLFAVLGAATAHAQISKPEFIGPEPEKGMHYGFYLRTPAAAPANTPLPIILSTANSGMLSDDINEHRQAAYEQTWELARLADKFGAAILVAAIPRPESEGMTYTHALDRDTLLVKEGTLADLDGQVLRMVDKARTLLCARGIATDDKAILYGHSAAGMFANRLAFLHPDRVRALIALAPGGWPLAPVDRLNGDLLTYPVGVGDLKQLTGRAFTPVSLAGVPMLFALGDKDSNDSVNYADGYDEPQQRIVRRHFGQTPQERWAPAEKLYRDTGLEATFIMLPGVGHGIGMAVAPHLESFMRRVLEKGQGKAVNPLCPATP